MASSNLSIDDLIGKEIVIWGYGVEGKGVEEVIKKYSPNSKIIIFDESRDKQTFSEIAKYCIDNKAIIFRSPGISAYRSDYLEAISSGLIATTGTQVWFNKPPSGKIITVTGSKGKSTTVKLLHFMLSKLNYNTKILGNYGRPVISSLTDSDKTDFWILELSSYQTAHLMGNSDIGLLLNLYEGHTDWHKNVDNYYKDKIEFITQSKKVYAKESDLDLLNSKDKSAYNLKTKFTFDNGEVLYKNTPIGRINNQYLEAPHNLENLSAALSILNDLISKSELEKSISSLKEFSGLNHRFEDIGTHGGIRFIDDSISVVPEATELSSSSLDFKNLAIIIGGKDLGRDLTNHAAFFTKKKPKLLIGLPETGHQVVNMLADSDSKIKCISVQTMSEAIKHVRQNMPAGSTCLLSPGASSYNSYKNYIEKSADFAQCIKNEF